jgi:hypothetical protein
MCRGKARRNVRHSLTRSYTPKHHAEKILTTRSTRRRASSGLGSRRARCVATPGLTPVQQSEESRWPLTIGRTCGRSAPIDTVGKRLVRERISQIWVTTGAAVMYLLDPEVGRRSPPPMVR